jgi:hypothetical protein
MAGKAGTNYRGPTLLCMFMSFSVLSLSIVQINPFRPSPSHSTTDSQSFQFSVKFLAGPPLLGDSKIFGHRGPKLFLAAMNLAELFRECSV